MNDKYLNYLNDCLEILIESGVEARLESDKTKDPFDMGRSFGYFEALDFLLNQAEFFGIKDDFKESVKKFSPYSLL